MRSNRNKNLCNRWSKHLNLNSKTALLTSKRSLVSYRPSRRSLMTSRRQSKQSWQLQWSSHRLVQETWSNSRRKSMKSRRKWQKWETSRSTSKPSRSLSWQVSLITLTISRIEWNQSSEEGRTKNRNHSMQTVSLMSIRWPTCQTQAMGTYPHRNTHH